MSDKIRVLVVDDVADTIEHVSKLLALEPDTEVVGAAASGAEALALAAELQPDVVLVDLNMPGMDGAETTERLLASVPSAAVVMMSVQGEADYLRKSMLVGARGFLVKPFSSEELYSAIRQAYSLERQKRARLVAMGPGVQPVATADRAPGRVIAVFSVNGGVGRTTLAVNLAAAISAGTRGSVVVVDGNLQFGDVGLLLNISPSTASVERVLGDLDDGAVEAIDGGLVNHDSGLKVLLAPPSPETAELVTVEHLRTILEHLRGSHDFVVIDCSNALNDQTLTMLDVADDLLCVISRDLSSIKNMRLFLGIAERLGYEGKLRIVLNKADAAHGVHPADVERSLGRRIDFTVPTDPRTVAEGVNRGMPFAISRAQAQISQAVASLSAAMVGAAKRHADVDESPPAGRQRRLLFARR